MSLLILVSIWKKGIITFSTFLSTIFTLPIRGSRLCFDIHYFAQLTFLFRISLLQYHSLTFDFISWKIILNLHIEIKKKLYICVFIFAYISLFIIILVKEEISFIFTCRSSCFEMLFDFSFYRKAFSFFRFSILLFISCFSVYNAS